MKKNQGVRISICLMVLMGCAHAGPHRYRSVLQIMPVLKGQHDILERRLKTGRILPLPKQNFNRLINLLEELKSSPFHRYTSTKIVWDESCDTMIKKVNFLEQAWDGGNVEEIRRAFDDFTATQNQIHARFDVRKMMK